MTKHMEFHYDILEGTKAKINAADPADGIMVS